MRDYKQSKIEHVMPDIWYVNLCLIAAIGSLLGYLLVH